MAEYKIKLKDSSIVKKKKQVLRTDIQRCIGDIQSCNQYIVEIETKFKEEIATLGKMEFQGMCN